MISWYSWDILAVLFPKHEKLIIKKIVCFFLIQTFLNDAKYIALKKDRTPFLYSHLNVDPIFPPFWIHNFASSIQI